MMKRKTKKTTRVNWFIPTALVITLLYILYSQCNRESCESQFDKTLEYVNKQYIELYKGQGMNLASDRYFVDSMSMDFNLQEASESLPTAEIDDRFVKTMRQLIRNSESKLNSLEVNPALIESAQEEAYKKKALYNVRFKTNYLLIPVIQYRNKNIISEKGVESDCQFTVTFKLFIDKNAREQVLYHEIGQKINIYINELLLSIQSNPETPLDMCHIVDLLKQNASFENEINNICNINQKFLSLYNNQTTAKCSDQFFFGSGKFEVPPIYQPIMMAYFKILLQYLKSHQDEKYRLICKGYADATPVRGGGLELDHAFSINYSKDLIPISYNSQPSGYIIRDRIYNNAQLSHVRAWMGINKLHQTLLETHQQLPVNLTLWYQGSDESANRDTCDRKIQFHLVKVK